MNLPTIILHPGQASSETEHLCTRKPSLHTERIEISESSFVSPLGKGSGNCNAPYIRWLDWREIAIALRIPRPPEGTKHHDCISHLVFCGERSSHFRHMGMLQWAQSARSAHGKRGLSSHPADSMRLKRYQLRPRPPSFQRTYARWPRQLFISSLIDFVKTGKRVSPPSMTTNFLVQRRSSTKYSPSVPVGTKRNSPRSRSSIHR